MNHLVNNPLVRLTFKLQEPSSEEERSPGRLSYCAAFSNLGVGVSNSATVWAGLRLIPFIHRADEPPGPQATGKKARLVHADRTGRSERSARCANAMCDVPVAGGGASVLCLFSPHLVALSLYSHAWPFAVAKATQVCTRNRTSPAL